MLQRHEHLSAADAAWLRMDAPANRMIITALLTFDGRLDPIAKSPLAARPIPDFCRKPREVHGNGRAGSSRAVGRSPAWSPCPPIRPPACDARSVW